MVVEKNGVNKRSATYMFGQIVARLEAGDKLIVELSDKIGKVDDTLRLLPCGLHKQRLENTEDWLKAHDKTQERRSTLRIELKHALLVSLLAVALTSGMTFMLMRIFATIPAG